MSIELLTVGDANIDFIASIVSLPEGGEEIRVPSFEIHAGGSAANTCVAAERLGLRSGFIGRVGSGFFGRLLKREFIREGVDIGQLQSDGEVSSGIMFILISPDGERTMICSRGANTRLSSEDIDSDYVKNATILHVSGYTFLEPDQREAGKKVIKLAEEGGLKISLDPGLMALREARDEIDSILPSVDLLFLSRPEISLLSDQGVEGAGEKLLERGPSLVVLKLGRDGCLAFTEEERSSAEAYAVDIAGTTGAGDAFDAAFIVGIERGWDLNRITKFANGTGALSTTKIGARSALPNVGEVERFLKMKGK